MKVSTTLNRSLNSHLQQTRGFSAAYNVRSKFEAAYKAKMENMSKVQQKVVEPQNKAEYGTNYYN